MTASPTDFARHPSGYFLRRLACERGLSAHTVASRRTTFTLLKEFCGKREGIPVGKVAVATLDRDRIVRFLDWLESERGNCVATRNVRLDAIKTFFAYLMAVAPEHMLQCQHVLSIPRKREPRAMVGWLGLDAVGAMLEAPDSSTYQGLRDLALPALLYDSAARVGGRRRQAEGRQARRPGMRPPPGKGKQGEVRATHRSDGQGASRVHRAYEGAEAMRPDRPPLRQPKRTGADQGRRRIRAA